MDMGDVEIDSSAVRRHLVQTLMVLFLGVVCSAQGSAVHSDFMRLPATLVADYFGVGMQAVMACQRNEKQCAPQFLLDDKNYYVTMKSADSPPEIAFWHTDSRRFAAVMTALRKSPRFFFFDGAKLSETTQVNMAKMKATFISLDNLSLDLPRIGTEIGIYKSGNQVGKATFDAGQFSYVKIGLSTAAKFVQTNFCQRYACRTYVMGQGVILVNITGQNAAQPGFAVNIHFIEVGKPVYEIEVYRSDLAKPSMAKMLAEFLAVTGSTTTVDQIRKVCAKPEDNVQASYLSCRGAAYSNNDFTIRIVD